MPQNVSDGYDDDVCLRDSYRLWSPHRRISAARCFVFPYTFSLNVLVLCCRNSVFCCANGTTMSSYFINSEIAANPYTTHPKALLIEHSAISLPTYMKYIQIRTMSIAILAMKLKSVFAEEIKFRFAASHIFDVVIVRIWRALALAASYSQFS